MTHVDVEAAERHKPKVSRRNAVRGSELVTEMGQAKRQFVAGVKARTGVEL